MANFMPLENGKIACSHLTPHLFIPCSVAGGRARAMASRGRINYTARVKKYRPATDNDDEGGGVDRYGDENGSRQQDAGFEEEDEAAQATSKRFADIETINAFDEQMGFVHYAAGPARLGWMLNMRTVSREHAVGDADPM